MPKRGENIYKRKDGRWEGRYIKGRTAAGKAVYGSVYARSYRDVRSKLWHAIQEHGAPKTDGPHQASQLDFSRLAEEWFASVKPFLKESSYMKYWNLWNSYIRPKLGNLHLSEISQHMLESYYVELRVSGGHKGAGLSAKTAADTMSLLRSMFRYCSAKDITVPCSVRALPVRQDAKEMRVFSLEEQQILCRHIYSNLCMQNVGILVCLFTGIRIGELCALQWKDVSFSEKTLYIHKTMQRIQIGNAGDGNARTKIVVTTPKSRCSIRTIPLPEELAQLLQSIEGAKKGYFLSGSDTKWIEPRTMQNHFKRLLKYCTLKDANYHALRHTFATRCIEKGFDLKSLSEILGHSSVNITLDRYVHPSMQLKQENMQRLSELLVMEHPAVSPMMRRQENGQ